MLLLKDKSQKLLKLANMGSGTGPKLKWDREQVSFYHKPLYTDWCKFLKLCIYISTHNTLQEHAFYVHVFLSYTHIHI